MSGGATRVLVVDDSPFMRASLRHIIGAFPGFSVVGEAPDGPTAVALIPKLRPDIVTLDIDMPKLDGIGVLRSLNPRPGVAPIFIMVSAFTTDGAAMTLTALNAGATDFVPKASEHFKVDLAQVGDMLRSKLETAAAILSGSLPSSARPAAANPAVALAAAPPPPLPAPAPFPHPVAEGAPDLVVVAASTGGPQTLPDFLRLLVPFPAPIVIAQHIPPMFSRSLAESLTVTLDAPVVEGHDGMDLRGGTVYVLPGGENAEVVRRRPGCYTLRKVNGGGVIFRPNADILFRSAALNARRPVGVVLTGMGSDGCAGSRALAQRGCLVLAQDPATTVIWGMPRTVIEAGLASYVADVGGLARRLLALTDGTHPNRGMRA